MFDITFDTKDTLKMLRALRRLKINTPRNLDDMQRLCSVDMQNLLVENILNQKFAYAYRKYHPRYKAWKDEMVSGKGFWRLYDDLLRSITSFKTQVEFGRQAWAAGIPGDVMDRGGKSWFGTPQRPRGRPKPIGMYANILEYGKGAGPGGKHPARPLFTPTTMLYSTSDWPKRGDQMLKSTGRYWR